MGSKVVTQECEVTLMEALGDRTYLIAAQYDPDCSINRALKTLVPTVEWRGSVSVMRLGKRVFVTNLTDRWDRKQAERAVRR